MTVLTTERTAGPFVGDGVQRDFPFSIVIWSDEDVVATITTDDVETELSLGSHYTVTVNADQSATPGGVLRLLSPLPRGSSLFVTTDVSETQLTAITNAGGFFPRVVERALDKLTVLVQQASGLGRRALRVPEKTGLGQLPAAAERAGRVLMFDADGRPVTLALASIEGLPVAATSRAYTASGGETTVSAGIGFRPGSGALEVYCDGLRLSRERGDYTETALGQVVFARPLRVGEEVEFVSKTPAPVNELPSQLAGSDGAGLVGFDESAPYAPGSIGERLRALYVDDVAALRALPQPSRRCAVHLAGRDAPGDGNGGVMLWNPGSTAADDGDRFIVPASAPTYGRWERLTGRADLVGYDIGADGSQRVDVFRALRRFPAVSDFLTVQAAVAHCAATGLPLYWDESRTVTGNIPDFHAVRHLGLGTLTRSGYTWPATPGRTQAYTLHVSPTGSDANDGLSPDFPLATIQRAFDILAGQRDGVRGRAVVQLAAGVYTDGALLNSLRPADYRITINGPAVAANAAPTAIIDGTTATTDDGLFFSGCGEVEVRDILIRDFAASDVSSGVEAGDTGLLRLTNVHVADCGSGYYVRNNSRYFVTGGRISGCTKGLHELFGVVRNTKTVSQRTDGLQITNCTYGIFAKEHCTGHLDWTTITGCTYGVFFSRSCTANASDCKITGNQYGAVLRNGSHLVPLRIDWGIGTTPNTIANFLVDASSGFTVNENTVAVVSAGVGGMLARGERLIGVYAPETQTVHTGSTSAFQFPVCGAVPAGAMKQPGSYIRAVIRGTKTGSAGTCGLALVVGGTSGPTVTLPAGTTGFSAELILTATGPTAQIAHALVTGPGGTVTGRGTRALAFDAAYSLRAQATLGSAADSIGIDTVHIYSTEPVAEES